MQTQSFNYSEARVKLADIITAVDQGMIAIVHSKGRKVVIIPQRLMNELMQLREAQPSIAETLGLGVSRTDDDTPLPAEVSAHSPILSDQPFDEEAQPSLDEIYEDLMAEVEGDAQ